jgi:SAM-dependent methyltransferase
MAQWDDGYVTDVAYTSNFYREATPLWLATTALLLGHRPPDLARPFRYADLGCGNGLTTAMIAATSPGAEVWGFDFNPAHIENARNLAARAGLSNLRYVETSFAALAQSSDADLPEFDFIVSHGVISWISPENRRHLIDMIGRRLKPGGLAYLGYNVTTGWAPMVPVRALMRQLAAASRQRTDLAVPGVLDFVERMQQAGAIFFNMNPALEQRIKDLRQQDARYIAHEYLNADWHPLMSYQVIEEMGEAKCSFIGSATLSDNIDAVAVPQGVAPLLAEAREVMLRETVRDIGSAQGFRRDLYRRGIAPLAPAEQHELVDAVSLGGLGVPIKDEVSFSTPIGTVTGRPEVYQPLLAMLERGPVSIRQARQAEAFVNRPLIELLQAFTLLMSGGLAHPILPDGDSAAARASARGLNLEIARGNGNGIDLPRLAAPLIGSAVQADTLETLVVGQLLAGSGADVTALTDFVLATLGRTSRTVQRGGQPVTDPTEARQAVTTIVQNALGQRASVFRQLGIL